MPRRRVLQVGDLVTLRKSKKIGMVNNIIQWGGILYDIKLLTGNMVYCRDGSISKTKKEVICKVDIEEIKSSNALQSGTWVRKVRFFHVKDKRKNYTVSSSIGIFFDHSSKKH